MMDTGDGDGGDNIGGYGGGNRKDDGSDGGKPEPRRGRQAAASGKSQACVNGTAPPLWQACRAVNRPICPSLTAYPAGNMLNELAPPRGTKDSLTNTGLRVLIIEDQYDIAANIWDYLERRDYRVDHAADGVSGLARALGDVFDLIVLDLGLPRLDGLALCRQLRSGGHDTPILMLTARDTLDDKLRGFAEGADDYLNKPFDPHELISRIRAVLRRTVQGAPPLRAAERLRAQDLTIDRTARRVWRADQELTGVTL